ncbi:exopolygalacturonase-like [Gastrolobium bilobum]|uniref:exopolygalacturonase-like n=1 Tax=Gastrolobium bilobum TaxID=150636 RepID=UPI002AB0CA14|nr:exopolygalacturonase-like [Gastrolobium bilobum]XP_061373565.1 exopolygalacturonase-like [Gastrolobium bilobum]
MGANYLFMLCFLVWTADAQFEVKPFNVKDYGAIANGKMDNSVAFLKAWNDACNWDGNASILIPEGIYMLNPVTFIGPCKGWTIFKIKGILIAPTDRSLYPNLDKWIDFRYINQLRVTGGGILDGQGSSAWPPEGSRNNPLWPTRPVTMLFNFISNGYVDNLHSINSKGGHLIVFGCQNMSITNIKLLAPGDSANTDGIDIGASNGINITSSHIGTGDDCIAMNYGTSKVRIEDVYCGPGHGISVGSLGKNDWEQDVRDIVVKNCTFNGTSDGLRIKTWVAPLKKTLMASNFVYEDIIMHNVGHPINIDQQYCPYPPCEKGASHVQISNVRYKNIQGSGNTEIAVSFKCSELMPCQNITVENIDLRSYGGKGNLINMCSHAHGTSYGKQIPPSCI